MYSCIRCIIFINIIDRVVGAVVEQVHSSTFKFFLLKIQAKSVPETLFLPPSGPKCVWLLGSAWTH